MTRNKISILATDRYYQLVFPLDARIGCQLTMESINWQASSVFSYLDCFYGYVRYRKTFSLNATAVCYTQVLPYFNDTLLTTTFSLSCRHIYSNPIKYKSIFDQFCSRLGDTSSRALIIICGCLNYYFQGNRTWIKHVEIFKKNDRWIRIVDKDWKVIWDESIFVISQFMSNICFLYRGVSNRMNLFRLFLS